MFSPGPSGATRVRMKRARDGGGQGGDLVRLRKPHAAFHPRVVIVAALVACQARTVDGVNDAAVGPAVDWCSRLALDLDGVVCAGIGGVIVD